MRKFLVLFLLIILFWPQNLVLAVVGVYSKNPHFLQYNGDPFMVFNFGFNIVDEKHVKNTASTGLGAMLYSSSRKYCGVEVFDTQNVHLAYKDGNMQNGFDEDTWSWFRKQVVENYKKEGKIIWLNLWATTMFEEGDPYGNNPVSKDENCINYYIDPVQREKIFKMTATQRKQYLSNFWAAGRFDANMWSDINGGPLPTSLDFTLQMKMFLNRMKKYEKDFTTSQNECVVNQKNDPQCLSYVQSEVRNKVILELKNIDLFDRMSEVSTTNVNNFAKDFYNNIVKVNNYIILSDNLLVNWIKNYINAINVNNGSPKDNFYTLASPTSFYSLSDDCSKLKKWQEQNQCYQDQYIRKTFEVMQGYDNWMIQPMYEIDDTTGTSKTKMYAWVEHVKKLIRSLNKDVVLVYEGGQDSNLVSKFDAISQQGTVTDVKYPFTLKDKVWSWNKPVIFTGFDPLDKNGVRMDNQKAPWNSFTKEDYINNIGWGCNLEVMRNLVLSGISPAPFFHFSTYDENGYVANYARQLANFLETVKTWDDEPGDEITDASVPKTGFDSCGSGNNEFQGEFVDTGDENSWNDLGGSEIDPTDTQAKKVDLNNDNKIDIFDFGVLLSFWGKSYNLVLSNNKSVDLNGDNKIDLSDIGVLLSFWGK